MYPAKLSIVKQIAPSKAYILLKGSIGDAAWNNLNNLMQKA